MYCPRLIFNIVIFTIALVSCSESEGTIIQNEDDTENVNMLQSLNYETRDARVNFLSSYVDFLSEVIDVKFDLIVHDNSTGRVEGPSDYNYTFLVKLEQGDYSFWITDLNLSSLGKAPVLSESLSNDLPKWSLDSEPSYYKNKSGSKEVWFYELESILLVSYKTL
jgi:hypothetical protein